ncbi:MAG TPA: hypothetical protein VKY54_07875, partial [Kiloniellales bacterium]|nr:hypothetical protein [Kiloniellales bacterium]
MAEVRALTNLVETPSEGGPLRSLVPVDAQALDAFRTGATTQQQEWLQASGLKPKQGQWCLLPDAQGAAGLVLIGFDKLDDLAGWAAAAARLPSGDYRLRDALAPEAA